MISIEFNGLPGCGKSTVAEEINTNLLKEGYETVLYSDFLSYRQYNRFEKALRKIKLFNLKEFTDFLRIAHCVNHKFDKLQLRRVILAERICMSYRRYEDRNAICIIDQGIVQAVLSIIHLNSVKNWNRLLFLLNKILEKHDCIVVNAVLDSKTAAERIRGRNFNYGSRLNFIDDEIELQNALEQQVRTLDKIRDGIRKNSITLDMTKSTKINADVVCNSIGRNVKA